MIDFKYIIFSLLFICGCSTVPPLQGVKWDLPNQPSKYPVQFIQKDNGLYIDSVSSKNLLKNIEELDVYIKKLEVLIKEMKKYYEAK